MALTSLTLKPLTQIVLGLTCLVGFVTPASAQQEVGIQVGIVQRFGDRSKDTLTLKANSGDRLTIRFDTNGKPETLTAQELKLEIAMQPLAEPITDERVVFSTHRSFESAEDQAQEWRKQGIEVEIAQPERWQVWAKRDVYNTPLVRRLLLQSLQAKGIQTARIESRTLKEMPRPTWVINGFRYTRDVVDISAGSNIIQVDREKDDNPNRPYGGVLRLQPNAYGNFTLVNFVGIETYLRGVVPHEIGTWAPQPVLESQAVLARTYALRNVRRFTIDNYQLCATTQCQVYRGLEGAEASTDKAIAATRGLVLTYQNELVDAVYSSTSGGVTSSFNDIWHGWDRPYLRTVVDSVNPMWDLQNRSLADEQNFRAFIQQKKGFNEDGTNMFRWRYEVPMEELNRELKEYLTAIRHPLVNFKTIQNIKVLARSNGGRILKSAIITDAGTIELEKDDIQTVFEAPASTLFHVDAWMENNKVKGFIFTGGGFGHGVGLSQFGSYNLGKLGWKSDRILSFYFPGTQLQPINNSITLWRDHSTEQTSTR